MAINANPQIIPARDRTGGGDKEYTFVFDTSEDMRVLKVFDNIRIWQIFPSVCASTLCIPFGMMLGWPSPTYPQLLQPSSTIIIPPITIDQSAMIAGFLMIGNTISTPLSSLRKFETKYSLIFSIILMIIGWIIMWQANDIYALLLSRLFIGIGNGYGNGQLKYYIEEICEDNLAQLLIKQLTIYTNFGIILSFCIGPFIEFHKFSIIAIIIATVVLFLTIFLPTTPHQLVRKHQLNDARKLLKFLNSRLNADHEIAKIQLKLEQRNESSWRVFFTNPTIRRNVAVFSVLVFLQQFSGFPSTIVYSQIFFTATGCPSPEYCAIFYAIIYLLANMFGVFLIPRYNKKLVLIISSITISIFLLFEILIIVFEINRFFNYISLLIMVFYNIFHSIGWGNVPQQLIVDLFPLDSRRKAQHLAIMLNSMFALIITKIFQVLYAQFNIYIPLCLFLCVSLLSIVFTIVFVPRTTKN